MSRGSALPRARPAGAARRADSMSRASKPGPRMQENVSSHSANSANSVSSTSSHQAFPALPTREEMQRYLLSFDMFEKLGRREEGVEYVTFHLERFYKTLEVLPRLAGKVRVLELGASPYYMTFLVKKYFGYEITTANFFDDYGVEAMREGETEIQIASEAYREKHTFRFRQF